MGVLLGSQTSEAGRLPSPSRSTERETGSKEQSGTESVWRRISGDRKGCCAVAQITALIFLHSAQGLLKNAPLRSFSSVDLRVL